MKTVKVTTKNLNEFDIVESVVEKWDIKVTNTIGDTIFCEFEGEAFSMKLEDYNRIFKK